MMIEDIPTLLKSTRSNQYRACKILIECDLVKIAERIDYLINENRSYNLDEWVIHIRLLSPWSEELIPSFTEWNNYLDKRITTP